MLFLKIGAVYESVLGNCKNGNETFCNFELILVCKWHLKHQVQLHKHVALHREHRTPRSGAGRDGGVGRNFGPEVGPQLGKNDHLMMLL